jgi:thiol:disulfide interchange protein
MSLLEPVYRYLIAEGEKHIKEQRMNNQFQLVETYYLKGNEISTTYDPQSDEISIVVVHQGNYFVAKIYFNDITEYGDAGDCVISTLSKQNSDSASHTFWGREDDIIMCRCEREITLDVESNNARYIGLRHQLKTQIKKFHNLLAEALEECTD